MITRKDSIIINRPVEVVFNYLTTPANWLEHLPTSFEIKPEINRPLVKGEKLSEFVKIKGLSGWVNWDCIENDGRTLFTVQGSSENFGGSRTSISYTFSQDSGRTVFNRIVKVSQNKLIMRMMEPMIKIYVKKEANFIMTKVKDILEN